MTDGWIKSAQGWIEAQGPSGDWTRTHVLDGPMLAAVAGGSFTSALDVGCGEGRFCRLLRDRGIAAIGVDPTGPLIMAARSRDPSGEYVIAGAEALPFDADTFDLVVSYLSLIDIAELEQAIAEMVRVLAPGGMLLIANLSSFATASSGPNMGWHRTIFGQRSYFAIDDYLVSRARPTAWKKIAIVNHHRPLSAYMDLLLAQGLRLTRFEEPSANPQGDPYRAAAYDRVPYAYLMAWSKDPA